MTQHLYLHPLEIHNETKKLYHLLKNRQQYIFLTINELVYFYQKK